MARIVRLDENNLAAEMASAAEVLAADGLAIFPTETFYGIAADHANPAALAKLVALKGRDEDKPLALILSAAEEADRLAVGITPAARKLMARFWPGPLTLILQARPGLDPCLVSADGGVGMRVSPHQAANGLAQALGRAITATSANLAGRPAVARVTELDPLVAAGADVILDMGDCPGGMASTVADARYEPPLVLRAGAVDVFS